MIKIIGIGGEPATGKTEIVKHFYNSGFSKLSYGGQKIGNINTSKKLIILGIYDDSAFSGTDRLSFSIQPKIIKFLDYVNSIQMYDKYKVLFEGDRLFNESFIVSNSNIESKYFILICSQKEMERRHDARHDSQERIFLKGRQTKYYRLKEKFSLMELANENFTDQKRIIKFITSELL